MLSGRRVMEGEKLMWLVWTDATQNYASNKVVAPLRQNANNTVDVWFAHGMKNLPPKDGDFMELEAGSNYTGQSLHLV